MAKQLAINVPDDVHEALARAAETAGVSLESFVARELEKQVSDTIGPEELLERLTRIGRLDLGNLTAADIIREGREERVDQILDAISRR